MSSPPTSNAKRKRLAALEERLQKTQSANEGSQVPTLTKRQDQTAKLAVNLPDPGSPVVGRAPNSDIGPQAERSLPNPSAFLESFLAGLLQGNVTRPDEIIDSRVRDKVVLLDNPTVSKSKRDRDAQRRTVRSLKHMSLREHRKNRTFEIPPELQRLELYQPLHALWLEYIEKLTQSCSGQALLSRLLTADYHGAFLSVNASKDPTYIGAEGLVVRETQNTFQMVTNQNKLRVVPKRGSIFQMKLGSSLVSLFGNQLLEERKFSQTGKRTPKSKAALPTIEL